MRYEHKYLLPEHLLDVLRRTIEPFVRLDPHVALRSRRTYTVRNIYFDDSAFSAYFEKNDGVEIRAKPRLRGYDSGGIDEPVFLEVKRRRGAIGSKDRCALAFSDAAPLLATADVSRYVDPARLPGNAAAARTFLFHVFRRQLRPVLFEIYEREPYVGTMEPSLRVTFDRDIRSSLFPGVSELFALEGTLRSFERWVVLEVKYDAEFGFPRWLRRFIAEHSVIREALSKYWRCVTDWDVITPTIGARVNASADWIAPAAPGL